jgi:hypothetical protein
MKDVVHSATNFHVRGEQSEVKEATCRCSMAIRPGRIEDAERGSKCGQKGVHSGKPLREGAWNSSGVAHPNPLLRGDRTLKAVGKESLRPSQPHAANPGPERNLDQANDYG